MNAKGILFAVLCATSAGAATIQVNIGPYDSAEKAAHDEANVKWGDGNPADDTVCTEAFAAVELQHYLRKLGGDANGFAIADDEAAPEGDVILVGGPGSNAAAEKLLPALGLSEEELKALGPEDYVIRSQEVDGRQVTLVAGGGRVGTLYGAYDLLHRLGVRWYAPGEMHEDTPARSVEPLPALDVRESPKFTTRGFHAWEDRGDPEFLLWMARNRLNYWCVEQSEKALLHKLGIMLVGGAHVLTVYYLGPNNEYPYNYAAFDGDNDKPADPYAASAEYKGDADNDGKLTYFEAHPEWYGLRNGKRSDRMVDDSGDNFCTSNADAMQEWMKNAVVDLAEGRYKDADIINAWTLDGGQWCECDNCKALGTPTDRNLLFVNEYARAIKGGQQDGFIHRPVRLLFLAYYDVLEPPTRPLPDDYDYEMCIATYFPIVRCYVHNLDDPTCAPNAKYMGHLQGWAVAPDRHYRGQICIGEYYNVSGYKCLPACFMHSMAHDIPLYYRLGARHFHYMHCTTKNWGNKALTNWQMARQLWEPATDAEALWADYFHRYGAAAEAMRPFYESLERMLCNVSELKYGLAGRLNSGAEKLFPNNHLKYEAASFDTDDGVDMAEILAAAKRCRELLEQARTADVPERVKARIDEDERLFAYGERTVRFYDALCRAYAAARAGEKDAARAAYEEAKGLAEQLEADTVSTQYASSHANAPNALDASRAAGALDKLAGPIGGQ